MATGDANERNPSPGSPKGQMNVMELEKKLKQSKGLQARFHPTWYLNSAFFMGQQWLFWNRSRLDRPRLEPWRQMVTDNRILGFVRSEVAKMTKAKPAFTIVPVTADDADLQASLTGQKVLNFLWRDLNMRNKLMDTLYWSRICGAGFWKIYWDAALGEKITVVCDEEGQIVCHPDSLGEDENGQPIPNPVGGAPKTLSDFPEGLPEGHKPKVLATGDVAIETVSPFEFFPDPIAKELEDAEWCIQVNVKSKEYVLQHFGIEMEGDTEVASGPAESQLFPSYQMGGASGYRGIKLHEYWLKPNAKHPNGLRVVWAKGKVLCEEPNPYKCLPYVMFKGVVVPGRFWPTSIVEQLRGPQMELNKAKSQILENAVRMGNPALLAAKQANVQYSGKPGERIDFDDTVPNAIPSYLQAPPMPQYVLQQQDRIETSMQEIAGQHEVSSAQVPAGVTAASAINLLMEADDTRLGPSIYDMEEMLGKAAEKLLELVAKYWTTERTILISGEDQEWDVFNFRGAALKENTHVECQAGSAFPQSKAAKQAAIQNILSLALQYGQQPMNPRNLRKVLRDYDAGGLEVLFGDLGVDEAQINRENGQLSRGAELHINAFDDQQGHIEGHTEFQKGPVYQQLPEPIQKNVERHVVEHREQLMKAMPPPLAEEQRAPQAGPGGPEAQASAPAPAAPEAPAKPPSETLNYKDAPPDVKRQIEQQAGLEPSKEEAHIAAQAALQAAPQPAAQPERQ